MAIVRITSMSDDNGKNNEDAYFAGEYGNKTVLCVCDGVGGTDAGEIASNYVIKNLEAWLKENDVSTMGAKTLHSRISAFVTDMHTDLQIICATSSSTVWTG